MLIDNPTAMLKNTEEILNVVAKTWPDYALKLRDVLDAYALDRETKGMGQCFFSKQSSIIARAMDFIALIQTET